jgi:CTP:phosphocholine cytidylyltransferase-like protein
VFIAHIKIHQETSHILIGVKFYVKNFIAKIPLPTTLFLSEDHPQEFWQENGEGKTG